MEEQQQPQSLSSGTTDRQTVPGARARGDSNGQRWKYFSSKKIVKLIKSNKIWQKILVSMSGESPGGWAPLVEAQTGLNVFPKWNISNNNVASRQTSLIISQAKHALVHRCPFWLPGAPTHRCKVQCDLQCWKSLSTTPTKTTRVAGRFIGSEARKFREL